MRTTASETCCECDHPSVVFARCVYEISPWEGDAMRWAAGDHVYSYCKAHDPCGSWAFYYDGRTVWRDHVRRPA